MLVPWSSLAPCRGIFPGVRSPGVFAVAIRPTGVGVSFPYVVESEGLLSLLPSPRFQIVGILRRISPVISPFALLVRREFFVRSEIL